MEAGVKAICVVPSTLGRLSRACRSVSSSCVRFSGEPKRVHQPRHNMTDSRRSFFIYLLFSSRVN